MREQIVGTHPGTGAVRYRMPHKEDYAVASCILAGLGTGANESRARARVRSSRFWHAIRLEVRTYERDHTHIIMEHPKTERICACTLSIGHVNQ